MKEAFIDPFVEEYEEGINEEEDINLYDFFGVPDGDELALDYAIETNDRD